MIYFWKEPKIRVPVQVLGNINRTGSGNLTIELYGGGRYLEFARESEPRKKKP